MMMNKNLKLFKGSHQNMWKSAHNHVGCVHVLSLLLSQCRGCHYHTQTEMNGNSILANNATKGFTGQIVVFCHWLVDWSGQVITRCSCLSVSRNAIMRHSIQFSQDSAQSCETQEGAAL